MEWTTERIAAEMLSAFATKHNWDEKTQLEIMLLWADEIFSFRNDNDPGDFEYFLKNIANGEFCLTTRRLRR